MDVDRIIALLLDAKKEKPGTQVNPSGGMDPCSMFKGTGDLPKSANALTVECTDSNLWYLIIYDLLCR